MNPWQSIHDDSDFSIIGGASNTPSILIEESRLEECMDYYQEHKLTRISIPPYYTHSMRDLEFLNNYPYIRGVSLQSVGEIDISGLRYLDRLEYLLLVENKAPFDLANFPYLIEFRGDWYPKLRITSDCRRLQILDLSKYKPKSKDLTELAELPVLEDLSIVQSPLTSISGIGRFPGLNCLALTYLTKLESIAAICELKDSQLEIMECEVCKKIRDHDAVKCVPSLRTLRFNNCGEIPSIGFLDGLKNLEDFRFVDTNVIDGDLRPLLRLKSAGFFKKKHYSHTPEEIDAILDASKVAPRNPIE